MTITIRRSLFAAALVSLFSVSVNAETIVKLGLGSIGPDIELVDGFLSTVDDQNTGSPGDQNSAVTFHGFVEGLSDITPPSEGSFSLSGVSMVGSPFVVDQGLFSLVTQQTTGGTFELYDDAGDVLLTATLEDGSLHGTTGASATGGFITLNLGTFTGPSSAGLDKLFSQLAPETASLAISLTDVISSPAGAPGLSVTNSNGVDLLQNFTADATANIGADQSAVGLPEPASVSMALFGLLGMLGFRRRR